MNQYTAQHYVAASSLFIKKNVTVLSYMYN